jgi:transposase
VPTKTKKRKRRIYTPEFKAEVINLIETSGKSIGQVARELELTDSAVRSWVEAARKQSSPTATSQVGLEAENTELRQRIKALELERSILGTGSPFAVRSGATEIDNCSLLAEIADPSSVGVNLTRAPGFTEATRNHEHNTKNLG